jgi:divalent metal cation (Fe/Co/Zn/Cd) transporter
MKVAKERKSSVLASNAVHHRVDCLTSIVALIAIGGSHIIDGAAWLDPVGGALVSAFVIKAGYGNTRQAIYELVDVGVDEELKSSVEKATRNALVDAKGLSGGSTDQIDVLGVQGIKAGQNYLMDIELAVPGSWTVNVIRELEETVREKVGAKVRGVRRVRIKFVTKEREQVDFAEEFIGADVSPRSSPEPEADEHLHKDHSHSHTNGPADSKLHKRH